LHSFVQLLNPFFVAPWSHSSPGSKYALPQLINFLLLVLELELLSGHPFVPYG
jgi:hypothetical protein